MIRVQLRGASVSKVRGVGLCAGVIGLTVLFSGWGSGGSRTEHAMRACLQRSGVVTKSTRAIVSGGRPAAFYLGPSALAPSTEGLVLIFKNVAAAQRYFYEIADGQSAGLQDGKVDVEVVPGIKPGRLAAVESCVFGPGARPVLSPEVPGQPVPTRATADLSSSVRRQVAQLGVFARPQNDKDLAGAQGLERGYVPDLTRLVATLPNHDRVYFVVYSGVGRKGYGSTLIQRWLPARTSPGSIAIPAMEPPRFCCTGVSERRHLDLEELVPNDVARVKWSWPRTKRLPALAHRIDTPGNLAVAVVPVAYSDPNTVIWYSASGRVLARN
jgi:hypothetical protein